MAEAKTYTLADWQAEGRRISTTGALEDAPFRCPLCGHIATARMFKDAGASPDLAPQACIGRVIGEVGNLHSKRPVPQPCDWAAFGLFGTLDTGAFVEMPDGKRVNVFSFAD